MRWLGETRLFLGAIYYSIKKRLYKGKLSILTNDSCEGQQPSSHNSSVVSDSSAPLLSTSSPMHPTPINNSNDTDNLPPITEPIDTSAYGWEVIEEAFTMIWVLQTSHAGATVHSSPTSRLADGVFTVLYTTNCSTIDLLKLLVLIDNGQHIHHPALKKRTCVAFRFEPKDLNDNGIFSLDGEFVEYGTIQGTVLPKAALTLGL